MSAAQRGRPRAASVDAKIQRATLDLLDERGYDGLRIHDVAAAAGVGLGALYRRWPGKRELVMAALRTNVSHASPEAQGDPVEDLIAALGRISEAVGQGLGKLVAACLSEPDSELARVAVEAKLVPMSATLTGILQRVVGPRPDISVLADVGPAYILWHTAVYAQPPSDAFIRDHLLPLMGVGLPPQ